ncbi:LacI family DNA-binding transcriptional regulator [Paenibacillus radicis (ex Gao et al. 2016)]|uniref:LacI family transcriptional regulator n=1 Tax=Paenibacillus radicis (ex Gao et al. 2016) TaxID=1737354 RepID=A0A917HH66_9BACL|nr:LacI family DNA-binding transcriptional regulator [Paenibacillus radicis (ex Gao et al. 2016)]GGG79138.1 LacI family transcriptional regulator [Paenibacillus radicis (ex Gao et al. 2016)]
MKVSIFDVAKKSGLSVVTVSRVLNNSSSVRQKNKEKVLQAMRELDYHPNASARSLARGKTGIIGLTLTTLHDSFFDAVVNEINDRLAEHGYYLALSISKSYEDAFHRSLFQEDRVDGVILLSPFDEDEYVSELKKKQIPFIMIDNSKKNPQVTSIIVDNFRGGYEATKHLIELGHTEIAHIAGPDHFLSSRERERGFKAALEEAGLQPYCIERGTFEISTGYHITKDWIASGKLPPAVFAGDDNIALGIMDACLNEGVRIPRDISVVGFDDQILASEFRPLLTTIRQPADKIGAMGVELLLAAISNTSTRNATVQIEPELIVRESTAPPQK